MSSLELGQTLLSPKQVPNERLVLVSLNDTYGSGKVERIEDKTPFYLLVYNEKRIFSRKIKSFTLEEIIIKIVYDASDIDFFSSFINTYYLVKLTPAVLLRMLLEIYNNPAIKFSGSIEQRQKKLYKSIGSDNKTSEELIRENVISILKRWIGSFYDFYDFPVLVTIIEQFIDDLSSLEHEKKNHLLLKDCFVSFKTISKKFSEIQNNLNSMSITQPTPLLGSKIPVTLLAEQITLIEYSLTRNIRGRELIAPNDPRSTNISKYVTHFKKMRELFIDELSKEDSIKVCARMIKRAVKLAHLCISFNNFNTPMEILSALFSPVMLSQEKAHSWELVSGKVFESLVTVSDLLAPDNNYEKYKVALKVNPSVPFLGVHIGDIRFIHDYNRTQNIEGINVEKLSLLSFELKRLFSVQGGDFHFEEDSELQSKIISNLLIMGEKEGEPGNWSLPTSFKDETDRLGLLAQRYANFVSDAVLLGREEVNFTDHLLRNRDWVVLATNSITKSLNKGEVIISENTLNGTSQVYLLVEGRVNLFKNNAHIKTVESNAILGETVLLDTLSFSNPEVIAETKCSIAIADRNFVLSLLESDPYLSLRFFSTIAIQLIDQFRVSSAKSSCYPTPLRKSLQSSSHSRLPVVVKPTIFTHGSGNLLLDPKSIRDQEVRLLFNWKENDVLIRGLFLT